MTAERRWEIGGEVVVASWLDHGHRVEVVEPEVEYALDLVDSMRPADALEVERYSGKSLGDALAEAWERSVFSRCCLIDGEVAGIWGLVTPGTLLQGFGFGWCLTSTVCDRHPGIFLRTSRYALAEALDLCPTIVCDVDDEYDGALQWLLRLGFGTVEEVIIRGFPFVRMRIG